MSTIGPTQDPSIFHQPISTGGTSSISHAQQGIGSEVQVLSEIGGRARASAMSEGSKTGKPIDHNGGQVNSKTATGEVMPGSPMKMPDGASAALQDQVKTTKFSALKNHLSNAFQKLKDVPMNTQKMVQSLRGQEMEQSARKVFENLQRSLGINKKEIDAGREIEKTLTKHLLPDPGTDKASMAINKKIQAEIKTISKAAAKALKHNQGVEIGGKHIKDLKVVVMKAGDGRLEVLVKSRLLGSGQSGDAYRAVSANEGNEMVLKYGKGNEEDEADLQNETEMLGILNEDGPHEGVQERITVTEIKNEEGITNKVSKGRIYSHGDFQNQVEVARMAKFLDVPINALQNMTHEEVSLRVDAKIEGFITNLSEIHSKGGSGNMRKLEDELYKFVSEMQISVEVLLGKTAGRNLISECNNLANAIKSSGSIDKEKIKNMISGPLTATLQKCSETKQVETSSRMSMAGGLISGLRYIHTKGIIHGDIKPRNFFWDGSHVVIADLGGAQSKDKKNTGNPQTTPGYDTGSYLTALNYYSKNKDPENRFRAGQALDMRAMGVSIYEMMTGGGLAKETGNQDTFYGLNGKTEFYDNMKKDLIANGVPEKAADIIVKMATPLPFDPKNPPVGEFPLPVTDQELADLSNLLKNPH